MLNIKQNYAWRFFRFLVRPGSLFMHDVAEVFAFFVYLQVALELKTKLYLL